MYPGHLKYSREHTWLKLEDDNKGRVGITHYGQKQLGNIVFIELPAVGIDIKLDEAFGMVESSKATSDLYSPASGRVVTANNALETKPGLINKDPYGEGWMIVIKLKDPGELDSLMSAPDYKTFTETEAEEQ